MARSSFHQSDPRQERSPSTLGRWLPKAQSFCVSVFKLWDQVMILMILMSPTGQLNSFMTIVIQYQYQSKQYSNMTIDININPMTWGSTGHSAMSCLEDLCFWAAAVGLWRGCIRTAARQGVTMAVSRIFQSLSSVNPLLIVVSLWVWIDTQLSMITINPLVDWALPWQPPSWCKPRRGLRPWALHRDWQRRRMSLRQERKRKNRSGMLKKRQKFMLGCLDGRKKTTYLQMFFQKKEWGF